MRVLHVHNFYRQPGGEDQSYAAVGEMLENCGHEVIRFTRTNGSVAEMGSVATARAALWNGQVYRELRALIRAKRPDIAHFENIFPLVSPSAYYAAHAEGVPVVQTLHNFRIICPAAILHREGRVCEDCMGRIIPWPGVLHGCYRGSRLGSAVVATMLVSHRAAGTWDRHIDAYIALNNFVRNKFIEAGLDARKVFINPNFLSFEPPPGRGEGGYALFAGRLTPEKGVRTLLAAWRELGQDLPLKILGDGPEAAEVARAAAENPSIEWLGWRPVEDVLALTGEAKFVIVPSGWYEGFNRILLEAFAMGTPVVGSGLGSMQVIIDHRRTGLLFTPDDPDDLIRQVRWLQAHPDHYQEMRRAARQEFESYYTAEVNYRRLMEIYRKAHERMRRRGNG